MNNEINNLSLDTLAASLSYAMGIKAPEKASEPCKALNEYVDNMFGGKKADRIFMYNPDAIAQWIYEKYPNLMTEAKKYTDIEIPFCTVMPSVTPVCFGTMYTGAQPAVHGIRKYEKPVITIDTIFDALIRAGKKPVIVAETNCSLSKIYLERDMDYFIYDTIEEVNAKVAEIIVEDKYDFVVVYNGNYDHYMHKFGPEGLKPLTELKANSAAFGELSVLISKYWKNHNTLVGFAMDHGCHEIDGESGGHGLDMPEDLNIVHMYKAYPAENECEKVYRNGSSSVVASDNDMPYPRLCAHRGFNSVAPENSMPAFGAAVALGAQEIEFDIWSSKDGVIVSCHDNTLDRVSNESGKITDHTYEELLALDFGVKFGERYKGLKIVTFEEILKQFAGRVIMNIHVKIWDTAAEDDKMEEIVSLIRKYGCEKQVYFMSGNDNMIKKVKEYAPDINACVGAGRDAWGIVDRAIALGAEKVQLFKPYFNQEMIDKAHENGIICNVFWSDDPEEAKKFREMGIDTILTNDYLNIHNALNG